MAQRKRLLILAVFTRAAVVLALLAIGLSVFTMLVRTRKEPATVDPTGALLRVRVIETARVPVNRQWQGFGAAVAAPGSAADVPAQVRGVVMDVPEGIVAGATVRRGQVIARLDNADFRFEVEQTRERIAEIDSQIDQLDVELRAWTEQLELAQDDVAIAQRDLDRVLTAQERGSATQREVDQARAALLAAQRNQVQVREQIDRIEPRKGQLSAIRRQLVVTQQIAQRNLDRCTITSPLDGMLQSVDIEPGESVSMDQRVARVVDLRRVEVPVRLPAAARTSVAVGDEAIVQFDSQNQGFEIRSSVSRISPEDDAATRTVTMYVEVEQNPAGRVVLVPGRFVSVNVNASRSGLDGQASQRIVLPRRSVQGDRVWIVDESDRIRSRRVGVLYSVRDTFPQFGVPDENWVACEDSILPGTMVVLDAARSMVEGLRVQPVVAKLGDDDGLAARLDDARERPRESRPEASP